MTFIIILSLFGCGATFIRYDKVPLKSLALGTKGLVIEAPGSFKWEYGKQYEVPSDYPFGRWAVYDEDLNLNTDGFEKVKRSNAKRVVVHTPYKKEPMYGYLQIGKINTNCKGKSPATRSYYIQVPKSYVNAAQGGKISVVYESYKCKSGYYQGGNSVLGSKSSYSSWVLWISDRPF